MSEQEQAPGDGAPEGATAGAPDPAVLSEWLTQGALARELRISVDTLRRWTARRIGPPSMKLGMRVLYRRESVRDWLRSREKR